jgi:undecaprenyl-diphosphatase
MNQGTTPDRLRLGLAVGAFILFALMTLFVAGNGPTTFEISLIAGLRDGADPAIVAGPKWIGSLMRDITALGGTPVLTVLCVLLAGFLSLRKSWRNLTLLVVVVLGQTLIVQLLKDAFARTRPEIVPHLIETTSESFPSGHAASAASIYLLLAAMLAPSLPTSAARRYVFAAAIVMALLVGASRVVLGVHYPSDVLAGWSFGVGWTMTALLIADRIRSR